MSAVTEDSKASGKVREEGVRMVWKEFVCTSELASDASEVYVAGAFNDWLGADEGRIHPTPEDAERYSLDPVPGEVTWRKEIDIPPGVYDFKFVVRANQWIPWYEDSGYPRGNDAPGGPNFRIEVDASPEPSE